MGKLLPKIGSAGRASGWHGSTGGAPTSAGMADPEGGVSAQSWGSWLASGIGAVAGALGLTTAAAAAAAAANTDADGASDLQRDELTQLGLQPPGSPMLRDELSQLYRQKDELRSMMQRLSRISSPAASLEYARTEAMLAGQERCISTWEAQLAVLHAKAAEARTAAFWSGGGNLLTGVTDDTLLAVARYLPTATDLLHLGLTCTRFSTRCIASGSSVGADTAAMAAGAAAAEPPENWSVAEEAARQRCLSIQRGASRHRQRRLKGQRGASRRQQVGETWLGTLWRLEEVRRKAAVFSRAQWGNDFDEDLVSQMELPFYAGPWNPDSGVVLSEGGAKATCDIDIPTTGLFESDAVTRMAASEVVMREGRYYARFKDFVGCREGMFHMLGVVRPDFDVEDSWDPQHLISYPLRTKSGTISLPLTVIAFGAAHEANRFPRRTRSRGSRASACCSTSMKAA
jgi:hypothetical protein